jgi:HTH-type transcriptional regulator/antitoxin HipB
MKLRDLSALHITYDTKMDLHDIGARIREARRTHKVSQQKIADALGMSPATISNLENGNINEIGLRKVLALCEQLGLEITVQPRVKKVLGWQEQLDENEQLRVEAHNRQRGG